MTDQTPSQGEGATAETVRFHTGDGSAYAVPAAVLEQARVRDERELARLRALFEGESGEAASDVRAYLLPAQTLAQYRVPGTGPAEADRPTAGDDDTRGYISLNFLNPGVPQPPNIPAPPPTPGFLVLAQGYIPGVGWVTRGGWYAPPLRPDTPSTSLDRP